jgi:hypothetical protein
MYLPSNVNPNVCPVENPVPSIVTLLPVLPEVGVKVIVFAEEEEVALPGGVTVVALPDGGVCAAAMLLFVIINPGPATMLRIAMPPMAASTVYLVVPNMYVQTNFCGCTS